MDDYKFIEEFGDEYVLLNVEGETVPLSDIFVDMYLGEQDSPHIGMTEAQIAKKYDLTENQVAEAQHFFREDEDFLNNFDHSKSSDDVFEAVDDEFYRLTSKYEDVEMEVLDNSGDVELRYQLHVGDNTLEAGIEQDYVYLSDDNSDVTIKAEVDAIQDQILAIYNSMRVRNE